MTSTEEERDWALEEGVRLHNSKAFVEIIGENGRAAGMKLASVSGFSFDDSGNSTADIIPGNEEIIKVDSVIFAIGQRPDIDAGFGLKLSQRGRVEVSEDYSTGVPGVFAAGDAVTGTDSIIKAIAGGRAAAEKIDMFLGGDGITGEAPAPQGQRNPYLGKRDGFGKLERNKSHVLPPEERRRCFDEMDLGLSGEHAACEAGRCLQCDLRLDIAPQRFWTDFELIIDS